MKRTRSVAELREQALGLLDEDPRRALLLAREALSRQPDAESFYVCGLTLCESDEGEEGMAALRMAVQLDDEHVDAWVALGHELFDACEFEEARGILLNALRLDPHHPEALYYRACLRERRDDHDGAARDYQAAALVDPEGFPAPLPLTDETIDALADDVIGLLHPSLQRYLENVPILLDEVPSVELLRQFDPPARPGEVLGCFAGHALTERSSDDPWSTLPATILLFRRNLMRVAHDEETLLDELRITLLHEIGHFLGLDEEDLEERGLD
ncbi:MAG: metallopeptidase family protein [Pseudomonadota bacterium]|nr:metallopeptidase family protein [Pseudomonadota bacterium]